MLLVVDIGKWASVAIAVAAAGGDVKSFRPAATGASCFWVWGYKVKAGTAVWFAGFHIQFTIAGPNATDYYPSSHSL